MSKKKPTTSEEERRDKNGKRIGKRSKGTTFKVNIKREYWGQDPRADFKPPTKEDPEDSLPDPKDKASKHKYPPPKKNPLFRKKWMTFIDNVLRRENFNIAHLDSLEILCDLHVEYDELSAFIRKNGRTYLSVGRQGEVWKFYPEVNQLTRVQAQIREYTKMLGLLLKKDHGTTSGSEADEDEWT